MSTFLSLRTGLITQLNYLNSIVTDQETQTQLFYIFFVNGRSFTYNKIGNQDLATIQDIIKLFLDNEVTLETH
jgi:hypothetical protein